MSDWSSQGFAAAPSAAGAAHAHTFTVNSALDELGTQVGSGVCETAPGNGVCTLRRAIAEAQAIADRDQSASDIVIWLEIPGGLLQLAANAAPIRFSAFPSLARLAIVGTGKGSTIIDGHGGSVFDLLGSAVSLSGFTIRNADVALSLGGEGVSVTDVAVTDSEIGLRALYATLLGCEFLRIRGRAAHIGGPASFRRCVFADNLGEAIHAMVASVYLDDVTLTPNGGGISVYTGGVTMRNSTIVGNLSFGVSLAGSNLDVSSSTIADNGADGRQGGVYAGPGFEGLNSVTRFDHTIVAHNRPTNCAAASARESFRAIGPNLFTSVDCVPAGPAPIVADPLLGPLQDNGGPTPTRALLAGSPAIDAGTAGPCLDATAVPPAIDQRGFARPAGSACDLGAFELGATPLRPALTRDLNGDRQADFVWRQPATGQLAVWFMRDTSITSGAYRRSQIPGGTSSLAAISMPMATPICSGGTRAGRWRSGS